MATPPWGGAGQARHQATVSLDNPGPQEPADQPQHLAIGDAFFHQTHQDLVVDVVESMR